MSFVQVFLRLVRCALSVICSVFVPIEIKILSSPGVVLHLIEGSGSSYKFLSSFALYMSRKNAKSLDWNARKCNGPREEDRPCRYTMSWRCTNKYWSLFGPAAYSCGNGRNRATLTSFNYFKTRYLGTSLMHLGMSETSTSIGTFRWRWLRMKLESLLSSM